MNEPERQIMSILGEAVEYRSPEERAAFLEKACAGDAGRRARVEALLRAYEAAGNFLQGNPPPLEPAATVDEPPVAERPGTVIGHYKLLEPIGEGGMGTVFMAQQTEPVKRLVAVKLIKVGMDSQSVLARFEAERQALALMDHPNIAKVFDGGITEQGRPFFVMELVKGVPITRYCDDHMLTPRERLELFVPVCHAVQHAHQKGIIHRDIKPSNVLVALYDGRPVPKVIDFGVANATGQPLTDKTLVTGFGAMVGTPEYMSPEQTEFNQLDIDTRSDVYALGVLLYELLTGSTPFSRWELEKAGLLEILRVIREQEPPRPSVKLSTTDALPTIAAKRGSEPKTLAGLLRNELDWIVMKALEKDRNLRYDTATAFASDVQRYLAGEAVQAHPPSRTYRLRKFARKNRAALATAAAFAILLLAGAVVSGWLAVKAKWAETAAVEQREEADRQRKEAIDLTRIGDWNRYYLWGTLERAEDARREAERLANNLQVDANLAERRNGQTLGLLRLCRTLKSLPLGHEPGRTIVVPGGKLVDTDIPPKTFKLFDVDDSRREELREFVTAAILAAGQDYAPLLPPITHDGQEMTRFWVSPDYRTLLTLGKDRTARLWDTRTAKQLAVLQKGNEQVVNAGFSPDGQTVFTDDRASVARFWEVPSGRLRAETDQRDRYVHLSMSSDSSSDAVQINNTRILTRRLVVERQILGHLPGVDPGRVGIAITQQSPVELWDTQTGRLVARLDGPNRSVERFQFLSDGRWVTTVEGQSTLLVFAAKDGRLLARLNHPEGETVQTWAASPSGRRVTTVTLKESPSRKEISQVVRMWDTNTWQAEPLTMPLGTKYIFESVRLLTDDTFVVSWTLDLRFNSQNDVYRFGHADPLARLHNLPNALPHVGNWAHVGDGRLFDTRNWQHIQPPAGRKFHPDLARLAPDGRFLSAAWGDANNGSFGLIDLQADKVLPTVANWGEDRLGSLPGFGLVTFLHEWEWDRHEVEARLIPAADKLNIPPDLLELWVQVAVRGELNAEGVFVKWDEPAWERKRQELAARPAPFADFPFPGYVATDKLHWIRAEFANAEQADKLRLAKQLLERAEAAGDKAEAVRWRSWLTAHAPSNTPPAKDAPPAR